MLITASSGFFLRWVGMAHEALIACFRATNQLTEAERIETQLVDYTKKNPPPATTVTLELLSQPPAAFEDFRQNFFAAGHQAAEVSSRSASAHGVSDVTTHAQFSQQEPLFSVFKICSLNHGDRHSNIFAVNFFFFSYSKAVTVIFKILLFLQ